MIDVCVYLDKDKDQIFTVNNAWYEMQKEIKSFLEPLLKYISPEDLNTATVTKKLNELNSISFSFNKTSTFMSINSKYKKDDMSIITFIL